MASITLSSLWHTGEYVSQEMFGANAVFEQTDAGRPAQTYEAAVAALGIQNIRFGGGQADLDLTRANTSGVLPVDGQTAINIVTMKGDALRDELVTFLDWATARTASGSPTKATLIIPTKQISTADYAAFATQIEVFVTTVMQQYGDVIAAFQMGNEYWEMGETAYGIKASLGAEAIARGLEAAGYGPARQPDILVQMGTAGNQGSEFPATPGISDFIARNQAANNQIIDQLSAEAIKAIDGVTEHYYYNKTEHAFDPLSAGVKNINRDYAVWADRLGDGLDLHITEWNVKTTATAQHGMVAGSSLVKQFENMIALGVDGAHIWALDYHSRTALTLDTDGGTRLDIQGRLTNSAQGAVFDLMSDALVGKELVSATFGNGLPGIHISSYASDQEMVFYITSRSLEQTRFTLDLGTNLPATGPVSAVQIAMDPATSNGVQWQRGQAADHVEIDGTAYFYNEHDVDVVLTDMVFSDARNIPLTLNPFEVVELSLTLTGSVGAPAPTPPQNNHVHLGTARNDLIQLTEALTYIDGGAGMDTVILDVLGSQASIAFDGSGEPVLSTPAYANPVTLANVEKIAFADRDVDITLHARATDQSAEDLTTITELFIAYFNRAPAAKGLLYWATRLEEGMSLPEIAESFFVQPEIQHTYAGFLDEAGRITDTQAFVKTVFNNVLGRDPTSDYWVDTLERPDSDITPALFILAVLNGAKAASGSAADSAYLAAKTDIGLYFSAIKGLSNYTDTVSVMELYEGSAASLARAVTEVDRLHLQAQEAGTGEILMPIVGIIDDPFALG